MAQDSIQYLDVNLIQSNPFQPRENFDAEELEELALSIKTYGLLEPLVIAETPAGYQLIAGERRLRASKKAGLTEIPALIKKTTPRGMLEMALVENLQRVDLNPLDRAQGFRQLMTDFNLTATQICERIGKSHAYFSNSIRLLKLPDAIKDGLVGGNISEGHARAMMMIPDQRLMIECYKRVLKENASVRRTEQLARKYIAYLESDDPTAAERPIHVDETSLVAWREKLKQHIKQANLNVIYTSKQTRVTITIPGDRDKTEKKVEELLARLVN